MKTLPLGADKQEIIQLLIEWTELLAQEDYTNALEMFQSYCYGWEWTPWLLESAVFTYGCPGYSREEAEREFGSADYKITSLLENPHKDKIIAAMDIDFFTLTKEQAERCSLSETDYQNILGMIHYEYVPLNGELSDLTARFYIKKVDDVSMTLSFYDLHVM